MSLAQCLVVEIWGLLARWSCTSGVGAALTPEQTHQRACPGPLFISAVRHWNWICNLESKWELSSWAGWLWEETDGTPCRSDPQNRGSSYCRINGYIQIWDTAFSPVVLLSQNRLQLLYIYIFIVARWLLGCFKQTFKKPRGFSDSLTSHKIAAFLLMVVEIPQK